jgi:hypothetical protein
MAAKQRVTHLAFALTSRLTPSQRELALQVRYFSILPPSFYGCPSVESAFARTPD